MGDGSAATDGNFFADASQRAASDGFHALASAVDEGVFRLDADGRFIAVNDALRETTGHDRGSLLDSPVDVVLGDDAADRLEAIRRDGDAEPTTTFDADLRTADGESLRCELRVLDVVEGGGNEAGDAGGNGGGNDGGDGGGSGGGNEDGDDGGNEGADGRGVVAMIEADGDARGSEATDDVLEDEHRLEQYRAVTEAANDVIVTIDEDSVVQTVNPSVEDVFGYEPGELVGESLTELMPDAYADRHRDAILRYLETGEKTLDWDYVELPGERADGSTVSLAVSFGEVEHDGERYFTGVLRDVSERKEQELALEQNQRRYEAIFEDPNILVGLLATDGTVLDVNQTAMEYVDVDREAVRGEPFWETPWWGEGDDVRDDVREWTERAAAGEYVEFEADLTRPDGEGYTLEGFFRPVTDDDGEVVSIIVSDRDVTDRKRHERELELFRTLLDHSNDSVLVVDPESGQYLDVNRTACERRGYDREGMLSLAVPDLQTEIADREEWRGFVEDLRAAGSLTFHGRHRRSDGTTYPIEINATYVELDRAYVLAIARDVSERRERERELEQYETIVETIPDGAYVLDEERGFTVVNETFVEMTGYDRETLLGAELTLLTTEEASERERELRDQLRGGDIEVAVLDAEVVTADGDAFDAEIRFDALSDDGTFQGTAGVVRDVSERKEYRRKLEESNERLEQFAYAASHDLQEPLRMVTSYLQLLERRYADELDDEAEEFIDFAVDGAERMREMIDGLLEYSRVETRGDPFEVVDLETVLDDVLSDLQLQIERSDAEITAAALPTVRGDATQLRQVFQNLLENAIEYSGDEPPQVHLDAERAGDRWRIAVSDEGVGIDPDQHDRVFEVFQRLHSQESHQGTGIGLALCRRIVERHGGEIRVDSEPGDGSTFVFTLPAVDDAA